MNTHRRFIILLTCLALGVGHMALATPARFLDLSTFEGVSAKSLQANLKFLSSDELKGRGTPSEGLDIAARWIATQYEQAGLEPVGKDGYFQMATYRDKPVRNVIGVLRGSDPVLKDTYVIVSAHYDHLGMREGEGDTIYNGANDDGSGVVSMLELAKAFGQSKKTAKALDSVYGFLGRGKGTTRVTILWQKPHLSVSEDDSAN